MSHAAFRAALLADPEDNTTRRVYADWLRENGRPAAGARMEWFTGLREHLGDLLTSGRAKVTPHKMVNAINNGPEWARRLAETEIVRRTLPHRTHGFDTGVLDPAARDYALHIAELNHLGLANADDRDHAHRRIATAAATPHNVYHARSSLAALIDGSPGTAGGIQQAQWAARGRQDWHLHALTNAAQEYIMKNPPPPEAEHEEPAQLARPLGWLKDKISGWLSKPVPRDGRDGIAHTHAKNEAGVLAEKSAVRRALSLRLGTTAPMPMVDRYVAHIARFVKESPDNAAVKHYVDRAGVIGGTAGPDLTEAVKPLVGAVNMLLATHGLDEPFKKQISESKRAAFEHRSSAAPEPEAPQPAETADESPLPAPEEHAAPVNMHETVRGLLQTHAGDLNKTKAALKAEHGLSHAEAHEATRNFLALHTGMRGLKSFQRETKKNPDAKLAKPKPGAPVEPKHLTNVAYGRTPINAALAGTSLAFHLRQIGQDRPNLAGLVDRALARQDARPGTGADPYAAIGAALKRVGDARAGLFNWGTMHDNLIQDARVKALVEKHVTKTGDSDRRYWDSIHRGFGQGKAGNADVFWARAMRGGHGLSREQITQSIARLKDRALDKEYTQTFAAEKPSQRAEWRGVMGAAPSEEHARFAREDHCGNT